MRNIRAGQSGGILASPYVVTALALCAGMLAAPTAQSQSQTLPYTEKHNFVFSTEGSNPNQPALLAQGLDGNLYGTLPMLWGKGCSLFSFYPPSMGFVATALPSSMGSTATPQSGLSSALTAPSTGPQNTVGARARGRSSSTQTGNPIRSTSSRTPGTAPIRGRRRCTPGTGICTASRPPHRGTLAHRHRSTESRRRPQRAARFP